MTKKGQNRLVFLVTAIILISVGFVLGTTLFDTTAITRPQVDLNTQPITVPASVESAGDVTLTQAEQAVVNVYEQVSPSVVAINIVRSTMGFGGEITGSGTGMVIDNEGHILTNFHVVQQATDIEVNFRDGTITRAEVVGLDPDSDLAVIQVDLPEERLSPVEFGNSDQLVVGQNVLAIGSPFGKDWTLTSGIISALDRQIEGLSQNYAIGAAIQTDAPINPGNSGGPLLTLSGQVIGINSQIISGTRSSAGVGFAVPSNLAVRVAEALINEGEVDYSYLGITGAPISLTVMEALDLSNNQQGVVVGTVIEGGPADEAGLRSAEVTGQSLVSADIIVAIDGNPVTSFSSLIAYLAQNTQPGDTVDLTVLRDGAQITIPVTLGQRPSS